MKIEYSNSTEGRNPFNVGDHIEFDSNGRALCPACSPLHNNQSKTLSLVPNTDGAYKCFRGCTSDEIREAIGHPKEKVIPTALATPSKKNNATVSEEQVRDNCLTLLEVTNQHAVNAIEWLHDRGIATERIKKHKLGLTRCRIGTQMAYAVTIPIPDGGGKYYQKKRVAPWDKELKNNSDYRPWKQYGIPSSVYFTLKPDDAKETWLCEGEWDAIALAGLVEQHRNDVAVACFTCGCSSVPAKSQLDRLPGAVTIFYDRNDTPNRKGEKPGEEGAKKVAANLGDRGKIANVPMKDDCKIKGWDVSDAIQAGFIYESFERAVTEASFVGEKYFSAFEKGLRSARQIYDEAPDYVDWLVPDLLTSNELYCLAAEPRAGKSLFALGLAKAVASGGKFLDRPCQQGEVVYICKEDPDDKVKERLIAQEWNESELENVMIHNDFTLDDLPELAAYVRQKKPALIILDTLSRVNPNAAAENSAEIVDTLAPLQNLAQQENVCVLVVHHTRKKSNIETDILDIFDSVRGSGAIRATCRGMLVLCKAKDSYRLAVENGRTAVQDLRVHLNVANLTWLLNGFWSPPSVNLSQKELVLEWFEKHRKGSVDDVSDGTAIRKKYIYELLTRLTNEKKLTKHGRQRNTMYYDTRVPQVPQVPQVELEWNTPTPLPDSNTAQFHKSSTDPKNSAQPDQICNEMLNADRFVQNFEQKDNFVELSDEEAQCTVVNSNSAVPQKFHKSSTVELKQKIVTSLHDATIFTDDAETHTTTDNVASSDRTVDISSFDEFKEIADKVAGFYHNQHGFLRFGGFEGRYIRGAKSGTQDWIKTLWSGCTGKVELKE